MASGILEAQTSRENLGNAGKGMESTYISSFRNYFEPKPIIPVTFLGEYAPVLSTL